LNSFWKRSKFDHVIVKSKGKRSLLDALVNMHGIAIMFVHIQRTI